MNPRWQQRAARTVDWGMCALMNTVQRRHHLAANSFAELERYICECEALAPESFFALPALDFEAPSITLGDIPPALWSNEQAASVLAQHPCAGTAAAAGGLDLPYAGNADLHFERGTRDHSSLLRWESPVRTAFPENNRTCVRFFPTADGRSAPTVLMLHALMSASDLGYRLWARRFNERGWNACFVHLPYHYSRRPRGYLNGELAISADLVRTAQALRGGVIELRQLMKLLRARGWCSGEFGLWATSYGGWIGALLLSVESAFRFVALMAPIVNVEHAIWRSSAAVRLRRELARHGILPALVARHFHLTSPLHHRPLCGGEQVLLAAGDFDRVALAEDIEGLHTRWRGSELLRVPQGHFGYQMMPAVFARLAERGLL